MNVLNNTFPGELILSRKDVMLIWAPGNNEQIHDEFHHAAQARAVVRHVRPRGYVMPNLT